MSATSYFLSATSAQAVWINFFMFGVMLLAAVIGIFFFTERAKHDPNVHSPRIAWMRAWIYYCFVILFSWTTGVFNVVVSNPLATAENLSNTNWIIYTCAGVGIVIWGYIIWWPRGTLTHGRKLYVLPTLVHGVMWGIAAGLLYLSMYALVERLQFPGFVNGLVLVGFVAIYNLNYQLGWWDIHVSPPHNIKATNNAKVALAHNPFLIVALSYFIIYGNAGIYVLLNALAMAASAIALRFPPFWEPDGGPVSRATAVGE